MATDLIRYDLLVQDAFREIFRKVLTDVAAKGLPGEHHFLVTFRTGSPGVKMSDRLRQSHPQDMTIVLQHQFWDLTVGETGFSVGLSFKNVPEKLVIPFAAVTGFFDPSVNFGAEFTPNATDAEEQSEAPRALPAAKPRAKGSGSEPTIVPGNEKAEPARKSEDVRANGERPAPAEPAQESAGPKVVSIDAFRKKT
jgi:hypothetical protein